MTVPQARHDIQGKCEMSGSVINDPRVSPVTVERKRKPRGTQAFRMASAVKTGKEIFDNLPSQPDDAVVITASRIPKKKKADAITEYGKPVKKKTTGKAKTNPAKKNTGISRNAAVAAVAATGLTAAVASYLGINPKQVAEQMLKSVTERAPEALQAPLQQGIDRAREAVKGEAHGRMNSFLQWFIPLVLLMVPYGYQFEKLYNFTMGVLRVPLVSALASPFLDRGKEITKTALQKKIMDKMLTEPAKGPVKKPGRQNSKGFASKGRNRKPALQK